MNKATPFRIRPADVTDARSILGFITELADFEMARHEVEASLADIRKSLFAPDSTAHALIGEHEGKPVAMAVYFFSYSTWQGRNGLYLEDLYVSPECRGLGYGKAMLARLAALALAENCGRFEWSVLDWNQPAIDIYEAIGAEPQSEWIRYRLSGPALARLAGVAGPD